MRLEQLQVNWLDAEGPRWDENRNHNLVIKQPTDEAICNSYFESTCMKLNGVAQAQATVSGNTNPWQLDGCVTFHFRE